MRKMTNTVLKTQLKKKIEEHQALLDEMLKGEGLINVDLKLPVTPAQSRYSWPTESEELLLQSCKMVREELREYGHIRISITM